VAEIAWGEQSLSAENEPVINYIVETFTYHHAFLSPVKVTPIAIAINPL
jgi:hypothetical protein